MKEEDIVVKCTKCGEEIRGAYMIDKKSREKKLYHYRCYYKEE